MGQHTTHRHGRAYRETREHRRPRRPATSAHPALLVHDRQLINVCFMKVVHHLAVEVAQTYGHDDGKLTQARDDLAAVLKASRAQWNVIIGRYIFPVTQADPVRPIVPQKRPADPQPSDSVVERIRIVTDGQPGILFLTTVSVPALQAGAADMNLQLRAMAQRVEEVARDAGMQNRTPLIKMQVIFKNE